MSKIFLIWVMALSLIAVTGCTEKRHTPLISFNDLDRLELGLKVKSVGIDPDQLKPVATISRMLLVMSVNKESLAERIGVVPGDLLHTINDSPVTGLKDSYTVLQGLKNTTFVKLGLYRNHLFMTLTRNFEKIGEINEVPVHN